MNVDFLIIGGGIAGSSLAAELASRGSTLVLEREPQPGYHATGRSAAIFTSLYGGAVARALTRASRSFLLDPPEGFAESALLRRRGALFVSGPSAEPIIEKMSKSPEFKRHAHMLSCSEACALVPILRPERASLVVHEPEASDIDVHALQTGYLRMLRAREGTVLCNCEVSAIERCAGGWQVRAGDKIVTAGVLINAAGAWADQIAELAQIPPLGITPKRRTAVLVDPPSGQPVEDWPVVAAVDAPIYFKPDAGKLLLSPMDETPSPACDAQPEDFDVAVAVDNFEQLTNQTVRRVNHRWAGLRSFAADRAPVVGFDSRDSTFFWLAGQGGFGVQTAPALSRAAGALVLDRELPDDLREQGLTAAVLSPDRLRRGEYTTSEPHEFE